MQSKLFPGTNESILDRSHFITYSLIKVSIKSLYFEKYFKTLLSLFPLELKITI